jgi:hypothetical protein
MNERIKELAEQANIKYDAPNDVYYNDSYDGIRRQWLEKFAMLVIQDYENDVRESRREVMSELGYSRIGLGNV